MRALMPILSVLLAIIAAGSIAFIAWELTSDRYHRPGDDEKPGDDAPPGSDEGPPD